MSKTTQDNGPSAPEVPDDSRLRRLNRLHSVLSKTSEAVIRARDRTELYEAVCRILVEDGLLRRTLIAEVEEDAHLARPVISFGVGQEYLREPEAVIRTDGGPLSMGTMGTAVRTGVYDVCNDVPNDPRMKPWHESARKMGLLSSASFPLKLQGRTVALLVLFAGETGYFLEDEIELMNGVARSVSFAFESIEKEKQRQLAEMALRESEERFRNIFAAAATGIAISTPNGRYLRCNAAYCQMLGYTEDELLTRDFASLTHPEDLHLNLKLRDEILGGTRESFVMEKRYLRKDGGVVWTRHSVAASRAASGAVTTMIVVVEDITERKRVMDELRESEQRFSSAFEFAPVGVALTGPDGRWLRVNRAFCDLVGYSEAELLKMSFSEITHPDDLELSRKITRELFAGEVPSHQIEKRFVHKSGRLIAALLNISLIRDHQGRPLYSVSMIQDITDRKRSEARFRRLVDSNVQGVIFWNKKGEVTGGNDAFLKMAGYTREDLAAGRIRWAEMTPAEYVRQDERALAQITATGICETYEKEWIRKDGSRVPILIAATMFDDNPDEGVAYMLDLTERKKLEQQFRQAQKMESIGTLAGGIAHDFNNFLALIELQTHLLKSSGGMSLDQSKSVEVIDDAIQRAAALTRQLLLFSRKQTIQLRDLDLNGVVQAMTDILRRTIGDDIELQLKCSPLPLIIRGDSGMMDQVLMNLAVNSRDALPAGGKLVIETAAVDFDESIVSRSPQARAGSFVSLSVSDNGSGIAPENLSRIFEPFFTTKDVGKGTGLGLATLFGIVQQHDGWISVYSEVGQGTVFRIYLPRLHAISKHSDEQSKPVTASGGGETILLVEDDALLRDTVSQILSRLGYRVLIARNALSALEVWDAHRDEIRVLLTDILMPGGMTGIELGKRLVAEKPGLAVIYSSGYGADAVGKDFRLEEGVNFISKPFDPRKLTQAIRGRLDATAG